MIGNNQQLFLTSFPEGPKSRLDGLIRKILDEGKIDPPEEMLPANFW